MSLVVRDLSKAFEDLQVLRGVDLTFGDSGIYCLMGSSGTGKTTFLRILMGLEKADCGVIEGVEGKRFSAVFQEDRLCEDRTPMENVMMVAERSVTREAAQRELCRILPEESIWRPVYTLSGGMKRRTAVCRALLASFDILLMDEPFTGLDDTVCAGEDPGEAGDLVHSYGGGCERAGGRGGEAGGKVISPKGRWKRRTSDG